MHDERIQGREPVVDAVVVYVQDEPGRRRRCRAGPGSTLGQRPARPGCSWLSVPSPRLRRSGRRRHGRRASVRTPLPDLMAGDDRLPWRLRNCRVQVPDVRPRVPSRCGPIPTTSRRGSRETGALSARTAPGRTTGASPSRFEAALYASSAAALAAVRPGSAARPFGYLEVHQASPSRTSASTTSSSPPTRWRPSTLSTPVDGAVKYPRRSRCVPPTARLRHAARGNAYRRNSPDALSRRI